MSDVLPGIPAMLSALGPKLLTQLQQHADVLVEVLLQQRRTKPPTEPFTALHYKRGTAMFNSLHRHSGGDEPLAMLLDRAAWRLTADNQRHWRIALADPAICSIVSTDELAIVLYPDGTNIEEMTTVPRDVQIFRLNRRGEHEIIEMAPASRAAILRARNMGPLETSQRQWKQARGAFCGLVISRCRAVIEYRGDLFAPEILEEAARLLDKASSNNAHITYALEAAFHLGILSDVVNTGEAE